MNKKVDKKEKKKKKVYNGQEDAEIKSIAYFKNSSQLILFLVLIILFGLTFFSTLVYVGKFFKAENNPNIEEVIEINNDKNNVLIINNGKIKREITQEDIDKKENVILENYSSVEISTKNEATVDGVMLYDVRYNITKNDFPYNTIATSDSDLLVRFAYSFDNKEWTYVNNVISTDSSTLSPLMGHYYDISGINSNLRILTDNEITSKPGQATKIYWKSETIILSDSDNLDKGIEAEFKIEYKNNT